MYVCVCVDVFIVCVWVDGVSEWMTAKKTAQRSIHPSATLTCLKLPLHSFFSRPLTSLSQPACPPGAPLFLD